MQLWHDVWRLGHRGNHIVGEGCRVRAGETNPLQALDVAARAEQLAERKPVEKTRRRPKPEEKSGHAPAKAKVGPRKPATTAATAPRTRRKPSGA